MALTVSEAAKRWAKAKDEMARIKLELDITEPVIRRHFERTGKVDYRGLVGLTRRVRRIPDSEKLKAELGERYPDFLKPSHESWLTLLK